MRLVKKCKATRTILLSLNRIIDVYLYNFLGILRVFVLKYLIYTILQGITCKTLYTSIKSTNFLHRWNNTQNVLLSFRNRSLKYSRHKFGKKNIRFRSVILELVRFYVFCLQYQFIFKFYLKFIANLTQLSILNQSLASLFRVCVFL